MAYLLTALIPLAAITTVVILAKRIATHSFRCKHCSNEFRIPWAKVLVTQHLEDEYLLECPFCKIKDWCTQQKQRT